MVLEARQTARQESGFPGTLPDLFDRAVETFHDKPAIDFFGKILTFGDLGELVNCAARGYQDIGIGKGSKVGILMVNSPYYVIHYFATLKAGATIVNLSPLATQSDILEQVKTVKIDAIATLDIGATFSNAKAALDRNLVRNLILNPLADMLPFPKNHLYRVLRTFKEPSTGSDRRVIRFADLIRNNGAYRSVSIDPRNDMAVLQFTGGTTGLPKGVMLTHFNLVANVTQIANHFAPVFERGKEVMLATIPFFHVFAMTAVMLTSISMGSKMVMLPDPRDIKKTLDAFTRKKPTFFLGVPGLFQIIANDPRTPKANLTSLRFGISGGAPLPPAIKEKFEKLATCTLLEGYGLTEAGPVVTINPADAGRNKSGSIGVPVKDTQIRIADPDNIDHEVATGDIGRICIKGPQVMKGYYADDEATRNILKDGWLLTGDLGHVDEDGYCYVDDRLDDTFKSNGFMVYPTKIEHALLQHPDIAECIVIGIDDERRGKIAKAFIRFRDNRVPRNEEERISAGAAISSFLQSRLSKTEMPRQFEFRADSLPKTAVGKADRKALRAQENIKRNDGSQKTPPSQQPL